MDKTKHFRFVHFGARDWIRTSTSLRTLPPEGSASTNFATRAKLIAQLQNELQIYIETNNSTIKQLSGNQTLTLKSLNASFKLWLTCDDVYV